MSIRARMIILPFSIVLHYCFTKTSNLMLIGCHNVQLQYFPMFVTTSLCASSWHDGVCACVFTPFVSYPLHKFRLTLSFSYLWLWHISVLMSFQFLCADYVRVQLVHFFSFFLRLHDVETLFHTIFLCLHVVSYPVSLYLHSGLNSFSSCLHVGIDFLLFLPNLGACCKCGSG